MLCLQANEKNGAFLKRILQMSLNPTPNDEDTMLLVNHTHATAKTRIAQMYQTILQPT